MWPRLAGSEEKRDSSDFIVHFLFLFSIKDLTTLKFFNKVLFQIELNVNYSALQAVDAGEVLLMVFFFSENLI